MIKDIRAIYDHMQDEISRKLFIARLNVSATGDATHMTMLPVEYRNLNADIERFRKGLLAEDRKRTVIFGAGANGRAIAKQIPIRSLHAFIDNYQCGQTDGNTGLKIFSWKDYIEQFGIEDTKFVVSVSNRNVAEAMHNQLVEVGVEKEAILTIPAEYRNNASQYFDLFAADMHESFVDCGCYDAGTAFRFAGWCGGRGYDKIWCFEPDKTSYTACKELCAGLKNCNVYPYGTSNRQGTAVFQSGRKEESKIVEPGEESSNDSIEIVALDDFLQGERVTFIKMDIEGAELDTLKGSKRLIQEQKPKLAVSVYHKDEEIIEIPRLLIRLRPDYKLDIRHYSLLLNETVLYAY